MWFNSGDCLICFSVDRYACFLIWSSVLSQCNNKIYQATNNSFSTFWKCWFSEVIFRNLHAIRCQLLSNEMCKNQTILIIYFEFKSLHAMLSPCRRIAASYLIWIKLCGYINFFHSRLLRWKFLHIHVWLPYINIANWRLDYNILNCYPIGSCF